MTGSSVPSRAEIAALAIHEARLLDEKRFEEWYELFSDDAQYWIPLAREQSDPSSHNSLMHEDKLLLRIRIERLSHNRVFSQQPPSYSLHVLQQPEVEVYDSVDNTYILRTPFTYFEVRGQEQITLGAIAWHTLFTDDKKRLRIRQKRVNLLNCDAALPSIQLFM